VKILGDDLRAEIKALVVEAVREVLAENEKRPERKDYMTAKELAAEFGLKRTWFEALGRAGEIPRCKPGRYVLFKREDVARYLEKNMEGGQNGNKQN